MEEQVGNGFGGDITTASDQPGTVKPKYSSDKQKQKRIAFRWANKIKQVDKSHWILKQIMLKQKSKYQRISNALFAKK